ncbi:MAG: hypothetical protein SGILL_007854 [Bacillariaceae sp.]
MNFPQLDTNTYGVSSSSPSDAADVTVAGTSSAAENMVRSKTSAMKMPVSKKNNSKKTRMGLEYQPSKNAVICGRGKICTTNPGNRKLRALIKENLQSYGKATNKVDKTEIVSSIMEDIRKDCPEDPAFVKKEDGVWWEVDDAFAREKIGCIFRDSLFTKYRSSTKAKLARRKQQILEEEEIQRQQQEHQHHMQQKVNAAMLFGGLTGMDASLNAATSAAKQLQLSQMMNSNNNFSSLNQPSMGMFSAPNGLGFPQHHSHRRDLLAHAPSMMGLPGGNQPSFMEPSMALGEAFDLLQNLQHQQPVANNQTSQLLGSLQQQQKRENYFKDLLHQQQQQQQAAQQQQSSMAFSASAATAASAAPPQQKVRRKRRNQDGDLESLPDDISEIFD